MKKFVYYFCASVRNESQVSHFSGIYRADEMITDGRTHDILRMDISSESGFPENEMTLHSLSFLHEVEE